MSQDNENQGRPVLGARPPEPEVNTAAGHGFEPIPDEEYDPEEARRLWLANRAQQRAAEQGASHDQSGNIGGSESRGASPSARVIEPAGSAVRGDARARTESLPAHDELALQPTVESEVGRVPGVHTQPERHAEVNHAPSQPQHAPREEKEVSNGRIETQAQEKVQVGLEPARAEHPQRVEPVVQPAAASPAHQPTANQPAPAAEGASVPQPPRQLASILDEPTPAGVRPEFMMLGEDDPSAILSGMALIGGLRNLTESSGAFNRFFRSLKRDGNGQVLFRNDQEEDIYNRITQIMQIASPTMQNGNQAQSEAWKRDDVEWKQGLDTGNVEGPFVIKNHPRQGQGLLSVIYRRQNSGAPVTVFLPASGFFITSKAPHENDFCDYDVAQTMDTNQVGLSTFGILLSASSGLYLKHMVNFALKFVVSTTLDVGDGDMHQTLYSKIDERDYWLVVMACTIAKYPSGIPWLLSCTEPTCAFEEEQKLNIARCIRYANGILTPGQQALVNRQREGEYLSFAQQTEYRKEHRYDPSSKWVDGELTFRFRHGSIAHYIDMTEEWVADINKSTTDAMGNYATEVERNNYMRTAAETRRLTRYKHMIESISSDVDGNEYVETDAVKIHELLLHLSSDRGFVTRFEKAIEHFNERTRLAVFGYMSHNCPACGAASGEKEGAFRGIVEISPDRLFFVLSRVVYEIQKLLTDQYESIG